MPFFPYTEESRPERTAGKPGHSQPGNLDPSAGKSPQQIAVPASGLPADFLTGLNIDPSNGLEAGDFKYYK
jgi:hypothetical protein